MGRLRREIGRLKRRILGIPAAHSLPRPDFLPTVPGLKSTLLIAFSPFFDQDHAIAPTLMKIGFAGGWAEVCGPAKLVPMADFMSELEKHDDPGIMMTEYEIALLSRREAAKLRDKRLFMWVGVHPSRYKDFAKRIKIIKGSEIELDRTGYRAIMEAQPRFVCNAVGKAGSEWYQGWEDDGLRWETIFPAVDPVRYFPEPNRERFGQVRMAYVGGYWEEKARGFDLYLRPWDDVLVPFGRDRWPYKNYGGTRDEVGERQLYSTAGLIPLVQGPHGWLIAEITERYLKAPACAAFCISDHNPALREVFRAEEMLQAASPEDFHSLVREFLSGKLDTPAWREKGKKAVVERHLYRHRAAQIKAALNR